MLNGVAFCQVQNLTVSGVVRSELQEPLQYVSVVLYQNHQIIAYSTTDKYGAYQLEFNIKRNEPHTFYIEVNSLGYHVQKQQILFHSKTDIKQDFVLSEKIEQLNEVVLEPWEKIAVQQETIRFKAAAFKDGSEQVVEDLLKNIPGLEVSEAAYSKVRCYFLPKAIIKSSN